MKKRKLKRFQVEPKDPEYLKRLLRFQADELKKHNALGAGPAIYRLSAERLEQLYPELSKSAAGG